MRYKTIARLKECKLELRAAGTCAEAAKILKRFRFKLAEYGHYDTDGDGREVCYAFFNHNGLRENPCGIQILYYMAQGPGRSQIAGEVKKAELYLF